MVLTKDDLKQIKYLLEDQKKDILHQQDIRFAEMKEDLMEGMDQKLFQFRSDMFTKIDPILAEVKSKRETRDIVAEQIARLNDQMARVEKHLGLPAVD